MNAERWQQVKGVLDAVLQLDPAERAAYLDRTLANDSELRSEVESLLCSHEKADSSFLRDPAIAVLPLSGSLARTPRTGRRIGVYEVHEEVGHGGMGEVYRAVRADGEFDRQVALKLVRGGLDSQFILERFRYERQILAGLDHPNIARLLDGGTTDDGLPYLVMELVDGVPIDRYCETHQLKIGDRIRLFLDICAAVQYAHQHLVIHRDIKPSNILVTADGIPKLLDFGIAKLTDSASAAQTTLVRPMTPEYASPEQVRGEAITTASDVYSLGVVLYQLLTRQNPHQPETHSPHELARVIVEDEPTRPSTTVKVRTSEKGGAFPEAPARWARELSGDVDNIVLKALRKDPERRYRSVEQLAEDLRRHLAGLPVSARQDSWSYRAGKFIRRHTAIVSATVVVILTLALGMAITLREKRVAEHRFSDLRKLANSLIFEIDDSIADVPGSTAARKLLVSRALEYLDSLSHEAKGDVSLQTEVATAYERVGDVLGYPYYANLGDNKGALQSYRKALEIRESLAASRTGGPKLQAQLAGTYFRIANVLELTGDLNGALAALRKALPITEKLAAGNTGPESADHLGGSHYFIGEVLAKTGDAEGALQEYRRAAAIHEASLALNPKNLPLQTHLAGDFAGLSASMRLLGDVSQAVEMQSKAVAILRDLSASGINSTSQREFLGEAITRLGTLQADQGKLAESLASQREAHGIFKSLLAADTNNHLARSNFAFTDNAIADVLVVSDQPRVAIDVLQESLDNFLAMSPQTSHDRYTRSGLASAYSSMGDAYSALAASAKLSNAESAQRWQEARSWYAKSLALWIDKRNRGELESGEQGEQEKVTARIARCEAALNPDHHGRMARAN